MNMPLMTHEMIQKYFDECYKPCIHEIKQTLCLKLNETYGELYYYSLVKLLKYLNITSQDHFLDIGSGIGKLVFQIFLTTEAASVTGIEINTLRHSIAIQIKEKLQQQLPEIFVKKFLNLQPGDFLNFELDHITIAYVCSSVLSFELLNAMGKKINSMNHVRLIVSFRKLPHLDNFKISKKLFLHCSWDHVACYIYTRK